MAAAPPPAQRLELIDALRGFAALWVFLYHIWNVLYPWGNSQVAPVVWDSAKSWDYYLSFFLIQFGYFGVTIFFVVSGFCIHLPQARRHAQSGKDGLKLEAFFQRRFWRLYPAYFAGLFVASLSLGIMRLMEYRAKGWPVPLPDSFYVQAFGLDEIGYNALFLLPFFERAKDLNSVLWTLVFEVQFYLLYPLLLWLIRRAGLLPVGIFLLVCECWMAPTPKTVDTFMKHDPCEYLFLSKYFEWYLGVLAAELMVNRKQLAARPWLLLATVMGVIASCGSVFYPALWPYRDIFVASTTCVFIVAMLQNQSQKDRPPGHLLRWFIWLGMFSYSLYLLHIPLMRMINAANTLLAESLGHPSWERWLILDCIPIVILASWGFFWLFERPFLKAK